MSADKIIVLEYSPSQRAFHRQTLLNHITGNLRAMVRDFTPDYLIIATFTSYEESDRLIPVVKAELARLMPETDLSEFSIEDIIQGK